MFTDKGDNGGDDDVLDEDDLRARAEKGRRKKRRLGAGAVGIEEESEEDDDIERMGEAVDDDVYREAEETGIKIEPFNMAKELKDGVIDVKSGSVNTRRKDSDDEDEDWLRDFEQKAKNDVFITKYEEDIRKARQRDREMAALEEKEVEVNRTALLSQLAEMLHWGESVKTAMNRLRPKHEKKGQETTKNEETTKAWNQLVEISDALVGVGLTSLYQMTREEIEDKIEDESKNSDVAQWQYRWSNSETVYGPYTRSQMAEWLRDGYFTAEGLSVLARKVGDGKFIPIANVDLE
jgi:hypothetical protein